MIFLLLISNLFAEPDTLRNIPPTGSISIEDIEKAGIGMGPVPDSAKYEPRRKETRYYDGCNYYTCDDNGNCSSTLLYCPPPKNSWKPPKHWKKVMEL